MGSFLSRFHRFPICRRQLAVLLVLTVAISSFFLPFSQTRADSRHAADRRPVAVIAAPPEAVRGEVIHLDGTSSRDPDGDPLDFRWSLVRKPAGSSAVIGDPHSPTASFTADEEGAYAVRLVVSDGKRASRPATAEIRVLFGRLSNPISPDDYRPVAAHGRSYLAENSAGKRLLYLEGSAYERGFATGKLCPRSVYRMTHDFIFNLVGEMLPLVGIDLDPEIAQSLVRLLWPLLRIIASANMDAVPGEFLEEMRGMADACAQEGYDVTFLDVLTLNLGFDVLESVFVGLSALFCNEFAVSGRSTAGGGLFHGRDFMFPTGGDVFSDEALLVIHRPDRGHPFIASAAPGFVGIPTGMNSRGVSCGMDVVSSILSRPIITGEGTLLLCRKAVQFGGTLEEAVDLIRDADRAVPWLYMIADGKSGQAVVLETTASDLLPPEDRTQAYFSRFMTWLLQMLFPWLGGGESSNASSGTAESAGSPSVSELQARLRENEDPLEENGVMIRDMEYTDPPWLLELIAWMEACGNGAAGMVFPLQDEDYPDLVAMTNHYILPWRAVTNPSTGPRKEDTVWRYRTMLGLLREGYGRIDRTRAMWIIDFLNPARCDYYGTDTTQSVKGHHVLMDNASHEMWSLHGYYDQAWAHADLDDFLK